MTHRSVGTRSLLYAGCGEAPRKTPARHPRELVRTLLALVLLLPAVAVACGGGEPEFTQEQAEALISAQWPESELLMRNAYIDEEGRGVALAQFDGEPWEFYFQPTEEGSWELEAIGVDGGLHYMPDLEQTSATMLLMTEAAEALGRYEAANDAFPEGDSPEALAVLMPEYLPEETQRHDAWGQNFLYESDGSDYTLVSVGADGEEGTRDDIILHTGEFIGPSGGDGGTQ